VGQYVIHLIREVYKYKCIYYLTNGRETSDPDLLRCFMLKRAFNLRPLSLSSLLHFKKHNRVEKDVQEKEST